MAHCKGSSSAAAYLALLCFEVGRHCQCKPQPLGEKLLRGELALVQTEAFAARLLQELALLDHQAAGGAVLAPVRAADDSIDMKRTRQRLVIHSSMPAIERSGLAYRAGALDQRLGRS